MSASNSEQEKLKPGTRVKLTGWGWKKEFHGVEAGDIVTVTLPDDTTDLSTFDIRGNFKSPIGSNNWYIHADGQWAGEVVSEFKAEPEDSWSVFRVGDRVKMVLGETTVVGKVSYLYADDNIEVSIDGGVIDNELDIYKSGGWSAYAQIKPAKIEVPVGLIELKDKGTGDVKGYLWRPSTDNGIQYTSRTGAFIESDLKSAELYLKKYDHRVLNEA